MDRIIAPYTVTAEAADVAPATGTGGYATDGDPASNTPATLWPAYQYNALQEEFMTVILGAGLTPNRMDNGQLLKAMLTLFPRVKTFAQAIALTEDVGPITVIGMDGIWEWSTSAYFTGYRHPRCGHWEDGWTPTPLAFQIEAHGGVWSESDPKEKRVIARFRESGLVVAIGSWLAGQGKIADLGGGTWKGVDYQNMHKRADGTDADTANPRTLGSRQNQAVQLMNLNDTRTYLSSSSAGSPANVAGGGTLYYLNLAGTLSVGVGADTRPANTANASYVHI